MLFVRPKIKINAVNLIVFIILFTQCKDNEGNIQTETAQYLNISQIIAKQIVLLKTENPPVKKNSIINAVADSKIFPNIDWEKELAFYEKININKPAFRDGFAVKSILLNGKLYVNYIRKKGVKSDVQRIWTVYTPASRKLEKILSKCVTENPVFYKVANYEFHFDTTSNDLVLNRYKMQGNQKFIFGNQDIFSVEGIVLWQ